MDWVPFTFDQIQYFFLIFVRIITIVALMPILGNQSVPVQIKIALSLILSVILFSSIMSQNPVIPIVSSVSILFLIVIKEILVGLAIGFVGTLLFSAVQFAGWLVDTEMGFGFVEIADPFTDEITTVWAQLQTLIFTILFLAFNGHYFLILAIQKSFELIPLTGAHFDGGTLLVHITNLVGNIFIIGVKFAAPIYVTLILTELALGVVARTVPQINIFFVGLPLKIFLGLGTAFLTFPLLASLFRKVTEGFVQDIWKLLYLLT